MGEQLEPGCQVADRYVVEELVGVGGFADVYRARHVELGSTHALKVLTWRKKGLAERFINEGRVQAQLGHPNVVTVTDVLRFEGHVALVMEYVDGTNLEQLLTERGALPLQEAMALFVPVLAAVAAAHDRKIWHRDLKPANVLLAKTPVGYVPKVADFGIAKIMDEMGAGSQTSSGIAMGSAGYMSPEQVRDSSTVDQRSDVFALGAILYEVLTGRRAFGDADGAVSLTSTLERDPPLIQDPAVPPEIAQAIQRAMSRDREARYVDCRALAKALGIGGHPLLLDGDGRALFASMDYDADRSRLTSTLSDRSTGGGSRGGALDGLQRITTSPGGGWLVVPFAAGTFAMAAAGALLLIGAVLVAFMRGRFSEIETAEVIPVIEPVSDRRGDRPRNQAAAIEPGTGFPTPGEPTPGEPTPGEPSPLPPAQGGGVQPGNTQASSPGRPSETQPVPGRPGPVGPGPAVPAPAVPAPAAPAPEVPAPGVAAQPSPAPEPSSDATADAGSAPGSGGTAPTAPAFEARSLLGAAWKGTARDVPFELRFTSATPDLVRGEAIFFAGTSQSRVSLSGTLDETTGALTLRSGDGRNKFEGSLSGQSIRGTYQQGGGKLLEWSVAR